MSDTEKMTISDEAVEAAASQLFDQDFTSAIWGETCEPVRENYRAKARAALEAAAPHMRQAFFLEMNLRAVKEALNTPFRGE